MPLPLSVIASQIGVPLDDLPRLRTWTNAFIGNLSQQLDNGTPMSAVARPWTSRRPSGTRSVWYAGTSGRRFAEAPRTAGPTCRTAPSHGLASPLPVRSRARRRWRGR